MDLRRKSLLQTDVLKEMQDLSDEINEANNKKKKPVSRFSKSMSANGSSYSDKNSNLDGLVKTKKKIF